MWGGGWGGVEVGRGGGGGGGLCGLCAGLWFSLFIDV